MPHSGIAALLLGIAVPVVGIAVPVVGIVTGMAVPVVGIVTGMAVPSKPSVLRSFQYFLTREPCKFITIQQTVERLSWIEVSRLNMNSPWSDNLFLDSLKALSFNVVFNCIHRLP